MKLRITKKIMETHRWRILQKKIPPKKSQRTKRTAANTKMSALSAADRRAKPAAKDLHADYTYNISAIRGNGLEAFKECIQEIILKSRIRIERVFPYSEAGKIQLIRQFGQLESEEYTEDGIKVLAYVPKEIEGKL